MNKEELMQLKEKMLKLQNVNNAKDLLPKENCYDFLYKCNKDRLNEKAICYLGANITYGELFKKIDNCAKAFIKMGVKKGDYVSVSALSTPEGIITFYALNKIGAVSHMINPTLSDKELFEHISNVNSNLYVTMDLFYSDRIKNVISKTNINKVVVTSLLTSLPIGINIDKVKYELITKMMKLKNPTDEKCIMWNDFYQLGEKDNSMVESIYEENMSSSIAYTSGSTGISKAVVSTNESINAMPIQMGMTDQTFAPNDIIFNTMPLWIYYSLVNNIHDPLCLGVTVSLDPLFNSKKISKRLKQYNFNHWNTIPAYVEDMCNDKGMTKLNLNYLKSITTGGDYLTPQLKEKADRLLKECNANIKVGQGYGASEILGSFSYTYDKECSTGSSGKPLVGNKAKIVDLETNKILGTNEIGELYLYSPTMMKEYYGNKEATNEVLIKDENGITWYKTGDLAHVSETGEIFVDGRIRRIVLTKDAGGFPAKIIPDKIKKEMMENELIYKCEIITVADEKVVNKPIAFVILNDAYSNLVNSSENVEKYLTTYCSHKLPSYMVPADIRIVDEIPLTAGLKPDWNKMEEIYNSQPKNQKKKIKRIFA